MFFDGQEDHANAVGAGIGKRKAELLAFASEELVRDLNQDSGAVAGFGIASASSAVRKIQQDLNSLTDDVVTFTAANAGYKPDSARIMLVRGVIETLGRWKTGARVG